MNEDLNKGREGNTIFMDWKIQEYHRYISLNNLKTKDNPNVLQQKNALFHLAIIIQLNVFSAENE